MIQCSKLMMSAIGRLAVVILKIATCFGCQKRSDIESLVDTVMLEAGDNAGELREFLNHYDDERLAAAEYSVAAIWGASATTGPGLDSIEALYRQLPGKDAWQFDSVQLAAGRRFERMPLKTTKDAAVITAHYLTENLEDAWTMWKSRPWNSSLAQDLFCEMLLPYRVGDEPLSGWRKPYREWLSDLEDTISKCRNSVDAARLIAKRIEQCPYNDRLSIPHRSALDLLEAPLGYCREDCDRTLYAMRSMGVPVAVDRILVSPETGTAHMWTVVWDNTDGRTRMFDNAAYLPTRDSVHYDQRRRGKVYRSTFAPDFERQARCRKAANPPASLLDPRLKDVTAEYFGHNKAEAGIWPEAMTDDADDVYLGVFANLRFNPVDIAVRHGNKAVFTDIEPNLIYAPVRADGSVCGYPFLLRSDGQTHAFVPDETALEAMTLTRKYPIRFHVRNRMASVAGTHIQSAPTARGPWKDIETIDSAPKHNHRRVALDGTLTGRFIRLYRPEGDVAMLSELLVCRDSMGLDPLPISVAGDAKARERYGRLLEPDTRVLLRPGADDCIIRIDSPDEVKSMFLVPQNDDNYVLPAQEYELMYLAGPEGWKSLGRKTAADFSVDFEAPKNAVLWLRNLTKGREEQIFIWHNNRQLYSTDLYNYDIGD